MQDAEKEIRSLLLSSPHGLTASELEDDYQQFMFKKCPYTDLGFPSTEALLRSMPDVARERRRGSGVFSAVPDSSTAAIASLIRKQRTKPPKRNRLRLLPRPPPVSRRSGPASTSKPTVPLAVRKTIKSIAEAYPAGIHSSRICEAYGRFSPDGSQLRADKWGLRNIVSLCQAISEVRVDLLKTGGAIIFPANRGTGGVQGQLNRSNRPVKAVSLPSQSLGSHSALRSPATSTVSPQNGHSSFSLVDKQGKTGSSSSSAGFSHQKSVEGSAGIDQKLKHQLYEVLKFRPQGIWSVRLPIEFKGYHKVPLKYEILGYASIPEFLSALPDVCYVTRPSATGDYLVFPVDTPPEGWVASPCVQKVVSDNLCTVLASHTDSLSVDELSEAYKIRFGCSIPLQGFASVEQLLQALPDVMTITGSGKSAVVRLKRGWQSAVTSCPSSSSLTTTTASASYVTRNVTTTSSAAMNHRHTPATPSSTNSAARNHSSSVSVASFKQPTSLTFGVFQSVVVTHVTSPGEFYVQFYDEFVTADLETLATKMGMVYDSVESDKFLLDNPQAGEICVCLFDDDDRWYRAIIEQRIGQMVTVLYVDYGNRANVPVSHLRRLKPEFNELPVQATRCQLAQVTPSGGEWSQEVCERFQALTTSYAFQGLFTEQKGDSVGVFLVDTRTEEDVFINDVLFNEGLVLLDYTSAGLDAGSDLDAEFERLVCSELGDDLDDEGDESSVSSGNVDEMTEQQSLTIMVKTLSQRRSHLLQEMIGKPCNVTVVDEISYIEKVLNINTQRLERLSGKLSDHPPPGFKSVARHKSMEAAASNTGSLPSRPGGASSGVWRSSPATSTSQADPATSQVTPASRSPSFNQPALPSDNAPLKLRNGLTSPPTTPLSPNASLPPKQNKSLSWEAAEKNLSHSRSSSSSSAGGKGSLSNTSSSQETGPPGRKPSGIIPSPTKAAPMPNVKSSTTESITIASSVPPLQKPVKSIGRGTKALASLDFVTHKTPAIGGLQQSTPTSSIQTLTSQNQPMKTPVSNQPLKMDAPNKPVKTAVSNEPTKTAISNGPMKTAVLSQPMKTVIQNQAPVVSHGMRPQSPALSSEVRPNTANHSVRPESPRFPPSSAGPPGLHPGPPPLRPDFHRPNPMVNHFPLHHPPAPMIIVAPNHLPSPVNGPPMHHVGHFQNSPFNNVNSLFGPPPPHVQPLFVPHGNGLIGPAPVQFGGVHQPVMPMWQNHRSPPH